jgi:hypothetical protein
VIRRRYLIWTQTLLFTSSQIRATGSARDGSRPPCRTASCRRCSFVSRLRGSENRRDGPARGSEEGWVRRTRRVGKRSDATYGSETAACASVLAVAPMPPVDHAGECDVERARNWPTHADKVYPNVRFSHSHAGLCSRSYSNFPGSNMAMNWEKIRVDSVRSGVECGRRSKDRSGLLTSRSPSPTPPPSDPTPAKRSPSA